MQAKPIWQSKTFWANIVALAGTLVGTEVLNAEMQGEIVAGIMAVLNVVLRFVTKQPVTM